MRRSSGSEANEKNADPTPYAEDQSSSCHPSALPIPSLSDDPIIFNHMLEDLRPNSDTLGVEEFLNSPDYMDDIDIGEFDDFPSELCSLTDVIGMSPSCSRLVSCQSKS